jgi:hypothetical protein
MPDLLIHIGAHKAGSTAIQNYLVHNREIFAQQGVLIPQTENDRHEQLRPPAILESHRLDSNSDPFGDSVLSLQNEIEKGTFKTIILSNEFIYCHDFAYVGLLISSLKPLFNRIRIILYVRPQHQLLASLYAQECKALRVLPHHTFWSGSTDCFPGGRHVKNGLFFASVLDTYAMHVGLENVTARLYDRSMFPSSDIILDFLGLLGIDKPLNSSQSSHIANESWGWKAVELSKYLAHFHADQLSQNQTFAMAAKRALTATILKANRNKMVNWLGNVPNYMNKDEQECIINHHNHDSMALKHRYLPELSLAAWSKVLPSDTYSLHDIPPSELSWALSCFSESLKIFLQQ